MKTLMLAFCLLLPVAALAEAKFAEPPKATADGGKVTITFAADGPTAVEVAVVDKEGKIVRHLAAGLIGEGAKAVPPLVSSLKQSLAWDRTDDAGKPVAGPVKVRVGLGVAAKLEKQLGFSPTTFRGIVSLAVSPKGELFVMESEGSYGASSIRVFDRDGKYLRTIMPYSAKLAAAEVDPMGRITPKDGQPIPIVYNAHGQNLSPYTSGMKPQQMAFDDKGNLVLFSSVGSMAEHAPPRFLLSLNEHGGAGKWGYIGPPLAAARGMLGGAGERDVRWFDHLAIGPDGQTIYVSGGRIPRPRHAVYRVKPGDTELPRPWLGNPATAGDDETLLNGPQGIAFDKAGRLYLAERGANRVLVMTADGKRIGKFPVDDPLQVIVHPATGEAYVSRAKSDKDGRIGECFVAKFSPFAEGGEPKKLAEISAGKAGVVMALDASAKPARLWVASGGALTPVTDSGDKLEPGANLGGMTGLRQPMFISADVPHGKLYVTELSNSQRQIDLATGQMKIFVKGGEAVADRDGNVYVVEGYDPVNLIRYDGAGQPVSYPGGDSNKMGPIQTASKGPNVGFRGHAIAPNGDIYMLEMSFYGDGKVSIYSPDGKPKKADVITHIPNGSTGIAVDRQGNIFIGVNIKPQAYPADFVDVLPKEGWIWWRKPRAEPWVRTYYNAYLYHWGCVFKFTPNGGGFHRDFKEVGQNGAPPMEIPAEATVYQVGYLNGKVGVTGAAWQFQGYGPVATTNLNWGDPSCVCMGSRLSVDDFGRVYVPDVFRFAVSVLDNNGNLLGRIGRYGNPDDPGLSFAWPGYTSTSADKLFIGDTSSRRVSMVEIVPPQCVTVDVP